MKISDTSHHLKKNKPPYFTNLSLFVGKNLNLPIWVNFEKSNPSFKNVGRWGSKYEDPCKISEKTYEAFLWEIVLILADIGKNHSSFIFDKPQEKGKSNWRW